MLEMIGMNIVNTVQITMMSNYSNKRIIKVVVGTYIQKTIIAISNSYNNSNRIKSKYLVLIRGLREMTSESEPVLRCEENASHLVSFEARWNTTSFEPLVLDFSDVKLNSRYVASGMKYLAPLGCFK